MSRTLRWGIVALALAAGALGLGMLGGSASSSAQSNLFVVYGEPGPPACADDPCAGEVCLLQGEAAPSCACQ
jgi:hypothetical protein